MCETLQTRLKQVREDAISKAHAKQEEGGQIYLDFLMREIIGNLIILTRIQWGRNSYENTKLLNLLIYVHLNLLENTGDPASKLFATAIEETLREHHVLE